MWRRARWLVSESKEVSLKKTSENHQRGGLPNMERNVVPDKGCCCLKGTRSDDRVCKWLMEKVKVS